MARKRKPLPPITMPTYLDGPNFIEFLQEQGIERADLTESQTRRWTDWEQGARASIYDSAGDILTEYMISERCLPDWVWASEQRNKPNRAPEKQHSKEELRELREDSFLMFANGETVRNVARELKVSETTAQNWRKKYREAAEEAAEETRPGLQGLKLNKHGQLERV